LALTVEAIATLIAPVLSHLAEDIWKHLPYPVAHKSIFQAGWVQSLEKWHNPELASKWEVLRDVRSEVNKVLESARGAKAIGSSLEAKVLIYLHENSKLKEILHNLDLKYLFITSQTELFDWGYLEFLKIVENVEFKSQYHPLGLEIAVVKADGEKCPRCWNYSTHIGESTEHPELCDRCVGAVAGTF
jgi:isoleucyl-tRNA synthetase